MDQEIELQYLLKRPEFLADIIPVRGLCEYCNVGSPAYKAVIERATRCRVSVKIALAELVTRNTLYGVSAELLVLRREIISRFTPSDIENIGFLVNEFDASI